MFETAMLYDLMEKLQKKAHATSRSKGFWDGPDNENIPTKLCLMHSEISEWLEAYRKSNPPCDKSIEIIDPKCRTEQDPVGHRRIRSDEEEAADIFIRLLDLCEHQGIDLVQVTLAKMRYNEGREHKHGGKKV